MLELATVLLGCFTTMLSIFLVFYFSKLSSELAPALSYMLTAEAVTGIFTTLFAAAAYLGRGDTSQYFGDDLQTFTRWIMFFTMSATSLHLGWKVRQVAKG